MQGSAGLAGRVVAVASGELGRRQNLQEPHPAQAARLTATHYFTVRLQRGAAHYAGVLGGGGCRGVAGRSGGWAARRLFRRHDELCPWEEGGGAKVAKPEQLGGSHTSEGGFRCPLELDLIRNFASVVKQARDALP